jgi:hypothetical protein
MGHEGIRAGKEDRDVDRVEATRMQTWAGIGLIAASGVIHLVETPEYLEEVRYIGVLFALSVIGALVATAGIVRGERWGWRLGALVAGASIAGYLLSRTVGLPGFRENSWEEFAEPLGLLSVLVEGLFLVLAAPVLIGGPTADTSRTLAR